MTDLLERLIEEARLHGRAALERENALAALEHSGKGLAKTVEALENIRIAHGTMVKTTEALRDELHESRNREQAGLVALRDISDSIGKFVQGGRRRKGKPYTDLLAAKSKADKLQDLIPF